MVTLTPLFSFSLLVETRKASSSVMSASSLLVTWGIITQLRDRLAPLIFLSVHKRVPVVTLELPNALRTPLDAEVRQMWLDLLRWMGERLTQGLGEGS